MPDIAFVNDRFTDLSEARVSVEDRGFQFGDGVYELLRTYGGVPFRIKEHLARLDRSTGALGIANPFGADRWTALIGEAAERSGYADAKIYLQVTRGVAAREHALRAALTPTVVITVRAMAPPAETLYLEGVDIVTMADVRWGRCDIKSICLLPNVLAKQQALKAGAFEAVFVRDGFVLEGATSNLMTVQNGLLATPPEGPALLSGITREAALQLAREAGIRVKEEPVTEAALYDCDEVFLTGTTMEILPVRRVNGRQIASGAAGPLSRNLSERFRKLHA
jgi:D-alanine transaminase